MQLIEKIRSRALKILDIWTRICTVLMLKGKKETSPKAFSYFSYRSSNKAKNLQNKTI